MIKVCKVDDIVLNTGVAALVDGQQVAIFRVDVNGEEHLYAVGNYDPKSRANVISRGIVGSVADRVVVASPIYKDHYCLEDGKCVEDESVSLPVWRVQVENGDVLVSPAKEQVAA